MANAFRGPFIVFIMGLMGFLMALIIQMAYDAGFLLDQFLTDSSMLIGLEVITIVVWLLAGCVIAAATQ